MSTSPNPTDTTDDFARVVLCIGDDLAESINNTGVMFCERSELQPLQTVLTETRLELHNALRDFEYYVQSSEAHGVNDSPIVNWTRDATQNARSIARYKGRYTVSVAGRKVFQRSQAEQLADHFRPLVARGILERVKVDSMDPAMNPAIPERYFGSDAP